VSLHPEPIGPVPEETVRVARAALPKGNVYMRMRDEFGRFDRDETFAGLFAVRGQPAAAPGRLALVPVLPVAEDLPDRAAADAVRSRIDWTHALGLELTDPGVDASVLSEFRARLVAAGAELLLLAALLARFRAAGLLTARGRQRTDATHARAAIRWLNRLECVGETLRHALNSLAVAAPEWLRPRLDPAWADRYGPRFDEFRLPTGAAERRALAEAIGADGDRLLGAVYAADAPGWLPAVPAVETPRRVRVRAYRGPDDPPRWRAAEDLPPASRMINSPHDVEARYSVERETSWTGYTTHSTETRDPDARLEHAGPHPRRTRRAEAAARRAHARRGLRRRGGTGHQPGRPRRRGRRPGAGRPVLAGPRRPGVRCRLLGARLGGAPGRPAPRARPASSGRRPTTTAAPT
jgi:transposase